MKIRCSVFTKVFGFQEAEQSERVSKCGERERRNYDNFGLGMDRMKPSLKILISSLERIFECLNKTIMQMKGNKTTAERRDWTSLHLQKCSPGGR